MSQQASGPLVARPGQYLQFLCCGWESSSSGLGSCAASGWAALPGAQGLWSAQGLTFPQAKLPAAARCEELLAGEGELGAYGHCLCSGCRCPDSAKESFVLTVLGCVSLSICPSASPCLLGSFPWGIALFIGKY